MLVLLLMTAKVTEHQMQGADRDSIFNLGMKGADWMALSTTV